MSELTGKRALVTGASRGIGKAIAATLAGRGATVVAAARGDNAKPTADEIVVTGGRAEHLALDVTEAGAAEAAIASVVGRHGRIDILVNNAGIAKDQLMLRMKREDWDAVIATNLTATFVLTQVALKPMLKQRGGRIVNISSVVGQSGNAGQANYAASKAGLIGYVGARARELAARGVTVNAVAPGFIETEMTRHMPVLVREVARRLNALQQGGSPHDVAEAIAFLARADAQSVTGQTLRVCGQSFLGA
jgi:3-oxoacyl-[acyl-carrier protein] reductase